MISIRLRIAIGDKVDTKFYGSDTVGVEIPSKDELIDIVRQMTAEAYEAYEKELERKNDGT